jgi:hypothetical protein
LTDFDLNQENHHEDDNLLSGLSPERNRIKIKNVENLFMGSDGRINLDLLHDENDYKWSKTKARSINRKFGKIRKQARRLFFFTPEENIGFNGLYNGLLDEEM